MIVVLGLLTLGIIFELGVHIFGRLPLARTALAAGAVFAGSFAAGAALALAPHGFTGLLALLTAYRVFNLLRVVQKRMHDHYLRVATRRTSLVLIALQLVVLLGWSAWEHWGSTGALVWSAFTALQLAVAAALFVTTVRNIRRTAWPLETAGAYADKDLPSITVAIPARNETEDLQRCLESVIASNYPKLEIIVLDDCSQVRRTPEIIRGFAQDGVRFIKGREPSVTWLPKNEAYARLAEEASGAYVLFCGVDVRFAPHSLRAMMATMLDRNKQMLCILPKRHYKAYGAFSLIQAMRYWWELALPRRQFRRPPVLSTCWMISREALKDAGGFKAVARAIVPEAHFARQLIATDGYSFLRSGEALGIESTKHVRDQRDTAVRMRYPQLHRRPEHVALLSLWELCFLVTPFILSIAGFWVAIGNAAHLCALLASVLLAAVYVMTSVTAQVNVLWFALVAQPFAALWDVALLHYSMWKYEFSVIDWRGRNVCIPVMHVVPNLPKK